MKRRDESTASVSVWAFLLGSPLKTEYRQPFLGIAIVAVLSALLCGAGVLFLDALADLASSRFHSAASATPLVLIGIAWLALHPGFGMHPIQFLKRLIAAVAFILWGVDQMLAPGWMATLIGDIVIALFVLDLALIIRGELTVDPND